jgi:hypothetical protein
MFRLLTITAGEVDGRGCDLRELDCEDAKLLFSPIRLILSDPKVSACPRMATETIRALRFSTIVL